MIYLIKNKTMKCSVVACIILSFASVPTSAMGGSGSHGGDRLNITFAEARARAAKSLRSLSYYRLSQAKDSETKTWLAKHLNELAHDVARSPHVWIPEGQERHQSTCAETTGKPGDPVHLSKARCQQQNFKLQDAIKLLIHESTHHLGVEDEDLATKIALLVYELSPDGELPSKLTCRIDFGYGETWDKKIFVAQPSNDRNYVALKFELIVPIDEQSSEKVTGTVTYYDDGKGDISTYFDKELFLSNHRVQIGEQFSTWIQRRTNQRDPKTGTYGGNYFKVRCIASPATLPTNGSDPKVQDLIDDL